MTTSIKSKEIKHGMTKQNTFSYIEFQIESQIDASFISSETIHGSTDIDARPNPPGGRWPTARHTSYPSCPHTHAKTLPT